MPALPVYTKHPLPSHSCSAALTCTAPPPLLSRAETVPVGGVVQDVLAILIAGRKDTLRENLFVICQRATKSYCGSWTPWQQAYLSVQRLAVNRMMRTPFAQQLPRMSIAIQALCDSRGWRVLHVRR